MTKNTHSYFKLASIITIGFSFVAILLFVGLGRVSFDNILGRFGSVLGIQTSRDKQEMLLVAKAIKDADSLLSSTPNPVKNIKMTTLANDPERIKTVKSLKDMDSLYKFSYAYKQTQDKKYLDKATEFLLAWANTNVANASPVDEGHLQKLFEGYEWIKSSVGDDDRKIIDIWLRTIAEKEMKSIYKDDRDINNWNSHRINIVGQIGYLLNDQNYINYATVSFKEQVQNNLYSNGSSFDFVTRDALHYHSFNLWALLFFAKTSAIHGVNLYSFESKSGSSLEKSVHFLYPYFNSEKTHLEFVNSTVAWDTTSGSKKLSASDAKKWNPKEDLYILELAYFFDKNALPIIQKITMNKTDYPSLEVLINYQLKNEIR